MIACRGQVAFAAVALASVPALLGAASLPRPVAPAPLVPVAPPAPATILARYEAALRALPNPPAERFEYAVDQLGLRNMEQSHRVYRAGRRERDETLVVDGYALPRPSVRIIANRTNRYDVAALAPTLSSYRFTYVGATPQGSHAVYLFKTEPLTPKNFAVSEVAIEGKRFLPWIVNFKIAGADARGSGQFTFGAAEKFWVVREAIVAAHLANGTTAHERIAWSNYSFPVGLPRSTFDVPHARPIEPLEPPAVATPLPASDQVAPDQP